MNIQTFDLISTTPSGVTLKSYLALPEAANQQPVAGILVAPEWWGVVEHPRQVTEALAKAGFAAVAMDVFGEGKLTTDVSQANEWMTQMLEDPDALMQRCQLILKDFSDHLSVDGDRLGAIGYCFGGKVALDMARTGLPLKAVATFHGNLSPIKPATGDMKAKVLVAHGGADSMVPMEAVEAFKEEMQAAGVDHQVNVYDHAKHGFTNPNADDRAKENGVDLGYDAQACEKSWQAMLDLMQQTL